MATFKTQIEDMTGSIGDDSALTQWLQDGTREIINILPPNLKEYCYSKQTFTSAAANSEAETMITGQLGSVFAGSVECRKIRPMDKHKASSSTSLEYASSTDPVYYVEGNKINILPASSSGIYYVVANSTVAHGSSSIDNFPNEAEYLVVLYASVKGLQRLMNDKNATVTVIDTTALGAIATELGETQAVCDLINTQTDSAVSSLGSAATEIGLANAEVDKMAAESALDNAELDKATAELGEAVTLVDSGIDTATAAIVTAAGRINTAVALANAEYDKCDTMLDLGEADTETNINTALGLIKTAIDQAASAADKFEAADGDSIFGDEATFLTADSQLAHVSNALIKAQNLIDGATMGGDTEPESAQFWLNDEDTEMVQATLQTAQAEIQRAQVEISHWTSMGDMRVKEVQAALQEADGYAKEVQARLSQAQAKREESNARIAVGNSYLQEAKLGAEEAQTYVNEVSARVAQVSAQVGVAQGYIANGAGYSRVADGYAKAAQGYINTSQGYIANAQGYINAAQGFVNEVQSKISIANGYVGEAKIRMERESQKYGWYQAQQVKLQQDYDKGIQMLIAQGVPQPVQRKEAR